MDYNKPKKFICVRCGLTSKRHDHLGGVGLCRSCDDRVGEEAEEARQLIMADKVMPERLEYLFKSKQLRLDN